MDKKEKLGFMALGFLFNHLVYKPSKKITLFGLGLLVGIPIGAIILKFAPEILNKIYQIS